MINIVTALVGAAISGFTTPGYTLTADNATDLRSKQAYISGLTGTQAGVSAHAASSPFTVTARRPSLIKTIKDAAYNGLTGTYSKVPSNEYLLLTRKGGLSAVNTPVVNEMRTTIRVFANSEVYDLPNVKALVSAHIGWVNANAQGILDTASIGTI